jgi:capsular polysaccharide export protein
MYRDEPVQSGASERPARGSVSLARGFDGSRQTILFLQSHPSWFARRLASAFEQEGCRVLRVNFCVGDAVYWLGRPALNYRGRLAEWPQYLRRLIARERVTDILFYGDGRPYHRIASDVAADVGINAYVYEFGYLRPDWITLERGGMSGRSHFPSDPATIRAIGGRFPTPDLKARTRYSMTQEMTHEISYNLVSYFLHLAYPRYVADRYYNPVLEYLTGIPKQMRASRMQQEAKDRIAQLVRGRRAFYLMPLQLQCDYQLRHNSRYAHQSDAIREVISSFAAHAPAEAALVLKCHPLDNGGEDWPKHIAAAAKAAGLAEDRLVYIEGGDLGTLLGHARGAVMINSTVGMRALIAGCPVKILGTALFDIDGLTHGGALDTFWRTPETPDASLVEALVRALAGTIQVKGDFFTDVGQAPVIATFVDRILGGTVNGSGAFVAPPPRLTSMRP